MTHRRAWTDYHPNYRAPQMRALAGWIAAGESGSVVGMGGAGKSNLLGFLANRPEVIDSHLLGQVQSLAILVDLNSLPANDLGTFYRLLLRSFNDARSRLEPDLAAEIEDIFRSQVNERDPFVVQTALLGWLARLTDSGFQVALVMDRFDRFVDRATPELTGGLRALRDSFKGQLCYLMGMRLPAAYLPEPDVLGELQELLDTRICWVGPMNDADARRMIGEETATAGTRPSNDEVEALSSLSGGYPALLKAACHWWLDTGRSLPLEDWSDALRRLPSIRARMREIWEGLSQAEQAALTAVVTNADSTASNERFVAEHHEALVLLSAKDLLSGDRESGWGVRGSLLERRAGSQAWRGRGRIILDVKTGELRLGHDTMQDLTNLERAALIYLLSRPRERILKTEIIEGVWPDDVVEGGIMDDALYQVIRGLRRKIEPDPGRPRYLVTWRGRPEGGYQLFPEGRPG